MRSGSIRSWPASRMMIRVRQWCTARCAHASWRTRSGSADRKISCGPRWNVLTCRNERFAFPALMVEGGEFPGGEGHRVHQVGQQPDDLAAVDPVLDHPHHDPAGMRALLPGQVHPRQVRPVLQDLHRAAGHAGPCPDQQVRPGLRIRLPQRHPGKAPVHDHQHPGRAARPRDRQLRLPAAEPAHPGIDRGVRPGLGQRHHPGLGEPRRLALASTGPPNAARFASVSGTSSTNPSTAATRIPRQNAPSRPAGATGPASLRNTASITRAPAAAGPG